MAANQGNQGGGFGTALGYLSPVAAAYNVYKAGAPDDFSARGSSRQKAAARIAQDQRDKLRQRGISEYGDLVGAYEGAEQRAEGMLQDRQRLAESTVAGMGAQALGGLGGMRGGGGAATMAGVGQEATRESMRQKLAGEQLLTDRKLGTAESRVQKTAFEQEAGSTEQEYSQAVNEADADIQQAIDDSQGEFWDDTDGATRKIRSIISRARQILWRLLNLSGNTLLPMAS